MAKGLPFGRPRRFSKKEEERIRQKYDELRSQRAVCVALKILRSTLRDILARKLDPTSAQRGRPANPALKM